MNDDPTEDLLKEIAVKHGVALDPADPILIMETMQARLVAKSRSAQQAMLDDYRTTLEALLDRWGTETKTKAERIVTASLTASTEVMKQQMGISATEAGNTLRQEVTRALDHMAGQLRAARIIGYCNLLAAVVLLCTAVVIYWTLQP